jgi:hypothetical protein
VGDAVEDWLNLLADEMKNTIKALVTQVYIYVYVYVCIYIVVIAFVVIYLAFI